MKLLSLLLLIPLLCLSQVEDPSEYQLIKYKSFFIKDYSSFPEDTLLQHLDKYRLLTTNISVNNNVAWLLNNWLLKFRKRPVAKNSRSRVARRWVLDFAISQSNEGKSDVILRQFEDGSECDSCSVSIFQTLIEDSEVVEVFTHKLKWVYAAYYQESLCGKWSTSYVLLYYKRPLRRREVISFNLIK